MSDLSDVCTLCKADIASVFVTPRQPPVVINGDKVVTTPCFVADQIDFLDKGRLIFKYSPEIREYAVICRKLTISGGNKPITTNPCNPSDPGTRYNTNVITWDGRLHAAAAGPDFSPPNAPNSNAQDGAAGQNGATGLPGNKGQNLTTTVGQTERHAVPIKLVIVALQVEVINSGNLVIDWAGQDGGDGGKGQNGGKGDKGTKGSDGQDASWPSSGCDIGTGTGGDGGPGGAGGIGGTGGDGGESGQIVILSLPDLISTSGVFNNPAKITLITQSSGGKGGFGGHGGDGGAGGNPGKPSSECGPGQLGQKGESFLTLFADTGSGGNPGLAHSPTLAALAGACANLLPAPLVFDASNVFPQVLRRCFSGSNSTNISITGQFLDQVVDVSCSISGVTVTINQLTSTDTQLDLKIDVAANSGSGIGDLIFKFLFPGSFGPTQTLTGAIDVEVCQCTGINPASGAQGSTVSVTLTGSSFDPSASLHDVVVSGLGVNAVNVAVVSDTQMTCDLIIDPTAVKSARSVTVKAGLCQFTLPTAFTVT